MLGGLSPAAAAAPPATGRARIEKLMQQVNAAGQFDGAVLVVENGRTLYRAAFGSANREWSVPNTVDTRFRIGSITKSFTAALVLQQVERGTLSLQGKVSSYLPDFPKRIGDRITIDQLLTHTSGLPDFNNAPDFFVQVQAGLLSKDEIVARIGRYELLFEPGTKFSYSNDGYDLLGAILEKVTGLSYGDLLRQRILAPVGMTGSGYSSRNALLPKRASGYRRTLAGYQNVAYFAESPASGMYSTVDDLLRWHRALAGNGLLSAASKERMWRLSPNGNAYGWQVRMERLDEGEPPLYIEVSEGTVPGFFAWSARVPAGRHLIVLLSNVRGPSNFLPGISDAIVRILYRKPYRLPPRSIGEVLLQSISTAGVKAAVAEYRQLKSSRPADFLFDLNELNSLGYHLMGNGRIDEAIAILELNVEAYPRSANAYDSLGEAYMRKGDKDRAIENYRRSLELNPSNSNAAAMIERLRSR